MKHRQFYIIAGLSVALYASNLIFNRMEERLRQPHHFVFDLSKALRPDDPDKPLLLREDEITEVCIGGDFNNWASPDTFENKLEDQTGWPMKKTGTGLWELDHSIPRYNKSYTYKVRIKPRSPEILKRFKIGVDHSYVWVADPTNPLKIKGVEHNDFVSVVEVRSVAGTHRMVITVIGFLLALSIALPLFRFLVSILLRVPFGFLAKFIVVLIVVMTLSLSVLVLFSSTALYNLNERRDSGTSEFVLGIAGDSIKEALKKKNEPTDLFNALRMKDSFTNAIEHISPHSIDLVSIFLYADNGTLLRAAEHSGGLSWWERNQYFAGEFFRDLRKFGRKLPQVKERCYGNLAEGPFISWKQKASAMFLIMFDLTRYTEVMYIFPIQTYRGIRGYMVMRVGVYGSQFIRKLFFSEIVLMFVVLFVSLVLFGVFGELLLEPMRQLTRGFQKVSEGDFNVSVSVKTKDEIQTAADAFNDMVRGLREKELIKGVFSRYVSKQVAEKILNEPEKLEMVGERREVSIIFADIRNFTAYSETRTPEEVVQTLNRFFSKMIDVIFKYEGTLDKFIGDCVMAVFGAPLNQPDHADRAVKCAWEMRKVMDEFNKGRIAKSELPIQIGIGVNSGEVVSGNVGSEKRTEFSVVGDSVNLASRLEDLAKEGQILIGPQTYDKVKGIVRVKPLPPQTVKGKSEPVQLYEVIALKA